jgi:DNA recombination protein RmuC
MNTATLVLLVAVAAGCFTVAVVLIRLLRSLRQLERPEQDSGLLVLQGHLEALREQVRNSLDGGRVEMDQRLQETNRVVGEVRRELGQVDRQVRAVTEAARGLHGLQELLRSPKARGGVGEHLLEEMLAQVLPRAHYSSQHEFSGGERVDAVLRLGEGMVPVDAKFPLENFHRLRAASEAGNEADERSARRLFRADVRRHVDAIAKRYIRPGEGTYDFAMMYIPSEAVYQETLQQEGEDGLDLFHYALTKKVVPVSPQSFYAYLQVIVFGLRGLSVERRTREIMNRLGDIQNRLSRFNESFDLVQRHLGNAHRQVDEAGRRLARLDAAVSDLSTDPAAARPELRLESANRKASSQ